MGFYFMQVHFALGSSSINKVNSEKCILYSVETTPVSVMNVTHIICEQCFYTSLSVINVNNLNSALTLIQA
jgi:hypothetical protein